MHQPSGPIIEHSDPFSVSDTFVALPPEKLTKDSSYCTAEAMGTDKKTYGLFRSTFALSIWQAAILKPIAPWING
jgi:hypothetical protein